MSPHTASTVYCSGSSHRKSGTRQLVDLNARHGPTAPGLVEDGNVFCANCAEDLARVRMDTRSYAGAS